MSMVNENLLQAVYRIRRADGHYLQHKHGSASWTSNHLYAGVWTRRRTANHLAHQHEAEVVVCDVVERKVGQEVLVVASGDAPAPALSFPSDAASGFFRPPPGTPPRKVYDKPCNDFLAKAWDGAGAEVCEHCEFLFQDHFQDKEAV